MEQPLVTAPSTAPHVSAQRVRSALRALPHKEQVVPVEPLPPQRVMRNNPVALVAVAVGLELSTAVVAVLLVQMASVVILGSAPGPGVPGLPQPSVGAEREAMVSLPLSLALNQAVAVAAHLPLRLRQMGARVRYV